MHDFQINIIWPVRILFPEEVHNTNLAKKHKHTKIKGIKKSPDLHRDFLNSYIEILVSSSFNTTVLDTTFFSIVRSNWISFTITFSSNLTSVNARVY